jgi:hypothetical protein
MVFDRNTSRNSAVRPGKRRRVQKTKRSQPERVFGITISHNIQGAPFVILTIVARSRSSRGASSAAFGALRGKECLLFRRRRLQEFGALCAPMRSFKIRSRVRAGLPKDAPAVHYAAFGIMPTTAAKTAWGRIPAGLASRRSLLGLAAREPDLTLQELK